MAGRLLVTIGTDGITDWVRTPDGQKFNLGTVSALNFVSDTVSRGQARKVLDKFLSKGEVMASVDEARMWDLMAPKRVRWAYANSSINPHRVEISQRKDFTMKTLSDSILAIERHVKALDEAASKKAVNMSEGVDVLVKLASQVKSCEVPVVQSVPEVVKVKVASDGLTYDTYAGNLELANTILATAEETVDTIDTLVTAGRKFNASQAKLDVRAVTTKVAGILQTDLTASWVREDLTKLASKADHIHGLFAKAK